MKSKYLFMSLAAGAMLAACSDDQFESIEADQAAKAPEFNVINDADLTRLTLGKNYKYNFEVGDLMSLYNGIAASEYNNSVYTGEAGESANAIKFTSVGMVKKGTALMVFPADTTFEALQATGYPYLTVPTKQTSEAVKLVPYMSEVLDIVAYDKNKMQTSAGYGRNYAIKLKQIGSTLDLSIDPVNDEVITNLVTSKGIAPLQTTGMGMKVAKGAADVLVSKIGVKSTTASPAQTSAWAAAKYETWKNQSDVDFTATTKVSSIHTENASNTMATFVLLPTAAYTSPLTPGTLADKAEFTIETNYGKVVVDETTTIGTGADKAKIWKKTSATDYTAGTNVAEGIEAVLNGTAQPAASGTFKGEPTGANFARTLKIDMKTLNMDGLHIKNNKHLIDALKVYDAVKAGQAANITFYLDGESATNKVFTMDAEGAKAMSDHAVAVDGKKVIFTICPTEHVCTTVVMENNAAAVELVPNMIFGTTTPVELTGNWIYSTKLNNNNASTITNKGILTVKSKPDATGSTLTKVVNAKGATINVEGITSWQKTGSPLVNFGTINIPVGAEFRMGNVLTNDATSIAEADQGKINNKGVLATVLADAGKIYNYGIIDRRGGANAKTYITSNENCTDFKDTFNPSSNKFGTIILADANDNDYSVSNTVNEGFIKLYLDQATINQPNVGSEANYVVVGASNTAFNVVPSARLKYVEFKNTSETVWSSTSSTAWVGVIVNNGVKVNIKKGNTVKANVSYIKGTVYQGGAFTPGQFTGYLGGAAGDNANVLMY